MHTQPSNWAHTKSMCAQALLLCSQYSAFFYKVTGISSPQAKYSIWNALLKRMKTPTNHQKINTFRPPPHTEVSEDCARWWSFHHPDPQLRGRTENAAYTPRKLNCDNTFSTFPKQHIKKYFKSVSKTKHYETVHKVWTDRRPWGWCVTTSAKFCSKLTCIARCQTSFSALELLNARCGPNNAPSHIH